MAARTAAALRASGTEQTMDFAFMICRIDMEIALTGTSARVLNQPSPNCCRRHASSRLTTMNGASTSKSAGGSLNARCPFSPIPTKATSIGWSAIKPPTRRHCRLQICLAVKKMKRPRRQRQPRDKPLPQIAAERRGMGGTHASVFIQMKKRDAIPSNLLRPRKAASTSNCDAPGGDDDVGRCPRAQRLADLLRPLLGRASTQVLLVARDDNSHGVPHFGSICWSPGFSTGGAGPVPRNISWGSANQLPLPVPGERGRGEGKTLQESAKQQCRACRPSCKPCTSWH